MHTDGQAWLWQSLFSPSLGVYKSVKRKEKNSENILENYLWNNNVAKIFGFRFSKSLEEYFAVLSKRSDLITKMQQSCGRIQFRSMEGTSCRQIFLLAEDL